MVDTWATPPQAWPADKAERRAASWLARSGGLPWVTPEAWSLLVARLDVRRTAGRSVAFGLLALMGAVWLACAIVVRPNIDNLLTRFSLALSLLLALVFASGAMHFTIVRADRSKVAGSGARMARGQIPRLRDVLGVWRCAVVAATIAVDLVFLVAVWFRYPARDGLVISAILLVGWASVVVLMVAGLHRPTIAVDAASLAIDERLRAQEVAASLALGYIATVLAVQLIESVFVLPIAAVAMLASIGLNAAGTVQRRWSAPVRGGRRWFQ